MEILGVGPTEFVFILVLALIILGPKDMQKAGRTIGKWLRGIVTSDGWKVFQQTSRELRTLPNRLMREANEELGDVGRELKSATDLIKERSPRVSVSTNQFQQAPADNKIEPPVTETKANESDSKADA
jgi:sec-independent protein translocase protein TatB